MLVGNPYTLEQAVEWVQRSSTKDQLRPLREQFPPEKASALLQIRARLEGVRFGGGAAAYYAANLRDAITSGVLLAAVSLSASLLEVCVRELVIGYSQSVARKGLRLQEELEAMRTKGFLELLRALVDCGLFEPDDGESAKRFYKEIRIPIHHGLPARFVEFHEPDRFVLFGLLPLSIGSHELEETIEDHAIEYLDTVVGILERNYHARLS